MYLLGTILMYVAAAALIPFPFLYQWQTGGTLTRPGSWHKDGVGVHLMCFMGALALVMCFAVANSITQTLHPPVGCAVPGSSLPDWVRPFTWALIAAVSWWRVAVLFDVQRED